MNKTTRARKLRNNSTEIEKRLWYYLREFCQQGIKFRHQQPIGPYFPDFVCLAKKLIIELDGHQHINSKRDKTRDKWLTKEGFTVLRFWDNQVMENIDGVMTKILKHCK